MEQITEGTMKSKAEVRDGNAAEGEKAADVRSSWMKRVLAYEIDNALMVPFLVVSYLLVVKGVARDTTSEYIRALYIFGGINLTAYGIVVGFYNRCIMMGVTGQSYGKKFVGIRLVSEATGQPIGVGNAIVREMAHMIDIVPVGLGFLLPIKDRKNQTGADKIAGSVVLDVPRRAAFQGLHDITR
ncbi:MAG TPA: RDD family protein [Streptosporangiaceae bacterium]